MGDILTQLQTLLDELAERMFSTLTYVNRGAAPAQIEGQPDIAAQDRATRSKGEDGAAVSDTVRLPGQNTEQPEGDEHITSSHVERDPVVFEKNLQEMVRDLLNKEGQIEECVRRLPGIGTSQREQEERLKELEQQLREVEVERLAAVREKEKLLEELEEIIVSVKQV